MKMPDREVKVDETDNTPFDYNTPQSKGNRGRNKSKSRSSSGGSMNRGGYNSNHKSNIMGISPKLMNFRNYCGPIIAQLASDVSYALYGFTLTKSDIPVQLNYTITYNRDSLWWQASVFSDQFLQQGNIRYVHLLGRINGTGVLS
jgi:hypothetical protein